MRKKLIINIIVPIVVMAAGYGLYRYGLQQGMSQGKSTVDHSAQTMSANTDKDSAMNAMTAENQGAGDKVDPSTWGIAEGETATRRHIKDGLKAGDIDPMTGQAVLYYHDPMMPGQKFDAPAKSPFMDMMLVPAYAGSEGADAGTIKVSARIQQNLGIRLGEVQEGKIGNEVTAVGTVAWNERAEQVLQARAGGFVEKLLVRAELDSVRQGQALMEIYVPEWVAVQEDFLSAQKIAVEGLPSLVDSAKQRMRQAGMSDAQIALVERTGKVQARTTLYAPTAGVVRSLMVREGSTVMAGAPLLRLSHLSPIWVEAEVPESLASRLMLGGRVVAQSPTHAGKTLTGTVQSLLPQVNPTTRTRKARMEIDNAEGRLVPGMFVQMQLSGAAAQNTLMVDSEALVRTGKRTLVMIAKDDSFQPVEVQVGREQNGQSEILSGLKLGQKIVLSGQFLIDSEASLKGVTARFGEDEKKSATYKTTGIIEEMDGKTLTLTHPEIPELKWPGMTMDFTLAPNTPMPNGKVGDTLEIEFSTPANSPPMIVHSKMMEGGAPASMPAPMPPTDHANHGDHSNHGGAK